MARVRQYQPDQVGTQVIEQPRARAYDATVGTRAVAQGLGNLGQNMLEIQKRMDTVAAEEALVKFERAKNEMFFAPETGYFNTQGRDAFDQSSDITGRLGKLKEEYGGSLSTEARKAFDRVVDQHVTRGIVDIQRHASKGFTAWESAVFESQIENTLENAALYFNDDQRLSVQRQLGEQTLIDSLKAQGLDDAEITQEKLETYRSNFYKNAIAGALAHSSTTAREMLEKHGSMLEGPDKLKIQKAIETKAKAEKDQSDAVTAVALATKLVQQYSDRGELIQAVYDDVPVEHQDKVLSEAMYRFNQMKTAETERRLDAYDEAYEQIKGNGVSVEAFVSVSPQLWNQLTAKQQKELSKPEVARTDPVVFNNLMSLPTSEKAKIDVGKYVNKLSIRDMNTLRREVQDARSGKHNTYLTTKSQIMNRQIERVLGKNPSAEKKTELYQSVQDAVIAEENQREGAKMSLSELDQFISDHVKDVIVSGFWNPNVNVKNTPVADIIEMNAVINMIPGATPASASKVKKAYNYLLDNDTQVTRENLLERLRVMDQQMQQRLMEREADAAVDE